MNSKFTDEQRKIYYNYFISAFNRSQNDFPDFIIERKTHLENINIRIEAIFEQNKPHSEIKLDASQRRNVIHEVRELTFDIQKGIEKDLSEIITGLDAKKIISFPKAVKTILQINSTYENYSFLLKFEERIKKILKKVSAENFENDEKLEYDKKHIDELTNNWDLTYQQLKYYFMGLFIKEGNILGNYFMDL